MLEINFWVVLYNLEPIWSDSNYWTKACVCSVYSLILNDSLVHNNLFRWSFWISITVENLPISQIADSFITYNPCGNHIQYIVYHFFSGQFIIKWLGVCSFIEVVSINLHSSKQNLIKNGCSPICRRKKRSNRGVCSN